jgi:DNA-binding CsgD family transcriptional regulator
MGVVVNDVDRLILEAWEKLGPRIMGDSDELQRRLARRRSALFARPQRAWCLCVRASDRRITPAHWVIVPEHALDLDHPEHPYEPIEHEVVIRPHALRKFCRAVRTDSWGQLVEDVAKELGTNRKSGLNRARWAGVFSERFVKGLEGRWGRHPVPLIHSWKTLDPSGRMFARPEQLWGSMWEWLADMIPDDFEQTVVRRPIFKRMDGVKPPPPIVHQDSPTLRIAGDEPSPQPSPGVPGEGVNIEHSTSNVQRRTEEYREYPDEMRFMGWSWVCPACRKTVRKIYYPIAPRTLFDYLGYDPARSRSCRTQSKRFLPYDVNDMPTPPGTFACAVCHGVVSTTRTRPTVWNEVVSWLSRGMLYGHEVEKPQWYVAERKVARHRKLGKPAAKREAVFNRLRLGWQVAEIALNMQISKVAVEHSVRRICEQEGVKNRAELAGKLGWKHPQPLNGRETRRQVAKEREGLVEKLLLEGLGYKEIAQRLNLRDHNVEEAAMRIYRKHGIVIVRKGGRRAFMERFGVGEKMITSTDAIGGL